MSKSYYQDYYRELCPSEEGWVIEQLAEERVALEKKAGEEYGRGVSVGKQEALNYTPDERERYGAWAADGEHHLKLKERIKDLECLIGQQTAELAEAKQTIEECIERIRKEGAAAGGHALARHEAERHCARISAERDALRVELSTANNLLADSAAYFGLPPDALPDAIHETNGELESARARVKELEDLLSKIHEDYNHPWPDEDSGIRDHRTTTCNQITAVLVKQTPQ